jgi:hypothetical protein
MTSGVGVDNMLSEYPIYFNNVKIPFGITHNASYNTVENVSESEAGTDMVDVVRYDKLTLSLSYKLTSDFVKVIRAFSKMRTFELKMYDTIEEGYVTRTVRMRNYKENKVRKSARISVSNGLWEVSFDLLEI